jgi:hypothetical protein
MDIKSDIKAATDARKIFACDKIPHEVCHIAAAFCGNMAGTKTEFVPFMTDDNEARVAI